MGRPGKVMEVTCRGGFFYGRFSAERGLTKDKHQLSKEERRLCKDEHRLKRSMPLATKLGHN